MSETDGSKRRRVRDCLINSGVQGRYFNNRDAWARALSGGNRKGICYELVGFGKKVEGYNVRTLIKYSPATEDPSELRLEKFFGIPLTRLLNDYEAVELNRRIAEQNRAQSQQASLAR